MVLRSADETCKMNINQYIEYITKVLDAYYEDEYCDEPELSMELANAVPRLIDEINRLNKR